METEAPGASVVRYVRVRKSRWEQARVLQGMIGAALFGVSVVATAATPTRPPAKSAARTSPQTGLSGPQGALGKANTPRPSPADTQDFLDQGLLEEGDDANSLGITGMMNDETVTKFGHEFFEAFVKAWKPLQGVTYNLRIGERYDPLRGSLIHVMINNNSVYEGFLTPRQEAIEELATQLSHELRAALKNRVPIDEELY